MKTYHNSDISGARENVKDIQVYGDGDVFKLISKASSEEEKWMKSTKAMEIEGLGCVIQVTTQQGDSVAEALTFVPNTTIKEVDGIRSIVCIANERLKAVNSFYEVANSFYDKHIPQTEDSDNKPNTKTNTKTN